MASVAKGGSMFGLGTQELMVILLIAMFLFGAQKLPELARGLGKSVKEFQKATSGRDEPEPKTPAPAPPMATQLCASCQTALQTEWRHCPRCGAVAAPTPTGTAAT
jgi:TatA/E family protein of Tat protein translocase